MRWLVISIIFCFLTCESWSLEQNYSLDDGLSDYAVTDIIQDHSGYIWIATRDGLNRFNGYAIRNFKHNPENRNSLFKNRISCLELDKDGNIWIGTRRGVSIYNVRKQKFFNLAIEAVSALEKGADGNMYIGTHSGCIYEINSEKLDYSKGTWNLSVGCRFKIDANVSTMLFENNQLWIGSKNAGLFLFRDIYNTKKQDGMQLSEFGFILSIYKDSSNKVWCSSKSGLFVFPDSQNLSSRFRVKNFVPGKIGKITQAADGKFYSIVSNNAIWEVELANKQLLPIKRFISKEDHILNFLIDRSQVMWFGTANTGLFKTTLEKQFFRSVPSIEDEWITAIYETRNGVKWLATRCDQLRSAKIIRYDDKQNTVKVFNSDNSEIDINLITSIFEDSKGNIWFTGRGKFYQLSQKSRLNKTFRFKKWRTKEGGSDYSISISEDMAGYIWLGSWNGVFRINTEKEFLSDYIYFSEKSFDHHEIASSETTFCYADSKDSVMWIGTKGGGLNRLVTPEHGEDFQVRYYLKSNDIWSIYKTDNVIWAGTSNGLYQLQLNENHDVVRQHIYKIRDGLPGNKITSIVFIDNKNIWLGTDRGLAHFNSVNKRIISYNKEDGLKSNYITGLHYDKNKHEIYVSSINGVNVFTPDDISLNDIAPQTQITGIRVNNKKLILKRNGKRASVLTQAVEYTKHIDLEYDENNIEIQFAALHYADPKRNKYAYKLSGAETDWQINHSGLRSASYLKLPAGDYVFMVKSANSDGIWSSEETALAITVHPPIWRTVWAYLFYIIIVCFGIFLYTRFSVIKASDKYKLHMQNVIIAKERELNEAKLRFFTNISHEIRTPLTLIYAPFADLLEQFKEDAKMQKRLGSIQQNVTRLMNLIDQLLEFRRVETGNLNLKISEGEVVGFIRKVKNSFDDFAVQKNIQFVFESNVDQYNGWFDFEKLNKILNNLISNSIKNTSENGRIKLKCNITDEEFLLVVEDNGVGIDSKKLDRIFERYYQVEGSAGGTGIGLALTKALVEMHKGSIKVESEKNEGSVFSVSLPNGKQHYRKYIVSRAEQDFIVESKKEELESWNDDLGADNQSSKEQLPIVLVVEDEHDINRYIKELLSDSYQVDVATNGASGLEKAIKLVPDVIISDIIMPEMNGIEMCQKLKSNIKTSHIPVIMLTAKSTEENQLEGMKAGANDYITKPFNPTILKQAVSNVVDTLKRQKTFNKNLWITEPEKIELPSKEDEFLKKVMAVIQQNLSDSRFEVTNLCAEIGLSRMQMHRKLKAITGQSSVELIRSVRFKKAAQLLETSSMNVSEVMWEVGIESTSHFSRTFKSIYGVSPSIYMKEKRKNCQKNSENS